MGLGVGVVIGYNWNMILMSHGYRINDNCIRHHKNLRHYRCILAISLSF